MKKLFSILMAVMCLSAQAQVNSVATTNALALRVPSANNPVVIVAPTDGSQWKLWRYSPSSTSTDWDNALVTTLGTGRWLNVPLTDPVLTGGGGGSGTVTSVSVSTANGVSGSVANATTTPAITLTLGAITPSSVAATGNVTGLNLSGSNTGDETAAGVLAKLVTVDGAASGLDADLLDGNSSAAFAAASHVHAASDITSGIFGHARLGTGGGGSTKFLREDGTYQTPGGGGDAATSGTLDQFADVTQTAGQTLAITASTTLNGGTHSGVNTGDQDLSSYATTSAVAAGYQPLDADLTELADNQGIIRTNGIWWGTMTGENIISDLITTAAGILPYTGETEPDNYFAPIIFVKNLSPAIADTVTDLLAVDIMGIPRWGYVLTGTYTGTWVYCPDVTDADNGTTIRRPDEIASDATPGRWEFAGPATGDVVGPSSATDSAIARFDGTTGKLIQNSAATIADTTGDITAGKYNTVAISGSSTPTLAVTGTASVSGANTGDQTSVSGNSGTATVLQTARNINGVSFNGSADITVTAAAGTLSGATLASGVTASSLTSAAGGSFGTAAFTASTAYQSADSDLTLWAAITPGTGVGTALAATANGSGGLVTDNGSVTLTTKTIDADDNVLADFPIELGLAASDETTAITTGTAKITFRAPYAFTLTAVRSSVTTAPTGSTVLIDINEAGTTVLSTKLMIDATEKTSTTATTSYVISDSAIADDAEITIDFDQVGSTIAGAGVKIWLIGKRSF